jgi:hypothetical protein
MPSRAIRAFSYDESRNELAVTFARGRTYLYSLIPASLAAAFEASPAKGAFHNEHIRDRFPFRRIAAPSADPSVGLRAMLAESVRAEKTPAPAPRLPVGRR